MGNELSNAIPTELVAAVKYLQVLSVEANGADETSSLENVLGRESVSALCGKQIRSGRDGVILQTRLSAPHGNDRIVDNINIVSVIPQGDVSSANLGSSSGVLGSSGGNRDDRMLGSSSVMRDGELGISGNLSTPRGRAQRVIDDLSEVALIGGSDSSESIGVALATFQLSTVGRNLDSKRGSAVVSIDIDSHSVSLGMAHLGIALASCLGVALATPIADIDTPWDSICSVILGSGSSTTSGTQTFNMACSLIE
jgi:hypothetical protein